MTRDEPIQPTQFVCPASEYRETHHLVPKANVPTCTYCGKTRSQIEEEIQRA